MGPEIRGEEDLTPSQIEELAVHALDKVQTFFAKHGIELKRRPKVKYLNMNCPMNAAYLGAANIDLASMKRLTGLTGIILMRSAYGYFDLTISDEAASESLEVMQNQLGSLYERTPLFKDGEDVDLFLPVRNHPELLDLIMAHESWHLLESERNVAVTEPLILEATATYAGNLFTGKSSKKPAIEDHFDVIYSLGAAIVEEELEGEKNPLAALLDSEVRNRIESRFLREAMPLYEQMSVQSFNPTLARELQAQYIRKDPAYECFRLAPTSENLLQSLRERGYGKLADDFSRQDLTKMLEYSKRLLE
jgi:hypothetical protein